MSVDAFLTLVIPIQIYFSYETYKKINDLTVLIPEHSDLKLDEKKITSKSAHSHIQNQILSPINAYIRSFSSIDYHILKDIVERKIEEVVEHISSSIPIPLYIGLGTTMLGIIVALSDMSSDSLISSQPSVNTGITTLVGGVRFAMVASFIGLLSTTINSILLRRAKSSVDTNKQDFYDKVVFKYSPEKTTSALEKASSALTSALEKFFLDSFFSNLDVKLSESLSRSLQALTPTLESQTESIKQLINAIREINIPEVAEDNKQLSRNLKSASDNLKSASDNFKNIPEIKSYAENLEQLNAYIDSLIDSIVKFNRNALDASEAVSKTLENANKVEKIVVDFIENASQSLKTSLHETYRPVLEMFSNDIKSVSSNLSNLTTEVIAITERLKIDAQNLSYLEKLYSLESIASQIRGELSQTLQTTSNLAQKIQNTSNDLNSLKSHLEKQTEVLSKILELKKPIDELKIVIAQNTAISREAMQYSSASIFKHIIRFFKRQ